MSLSWFVLALYVFLQSSVLLGWFAVDPKLQGVVGIAFVLIAIAENLYGKSFIPHFRRNG